MARERVSVVNFWIQNCLHDSVLPHGTSMLGSSVQALQGPFVPNIIEINHGRRAIITDCSVINGSLLIQVTSRK